MQHTYLCKDGFLIVELNVLFFLKKEKDLALSSLDAILQYFT